MTKLANLKIKRIGGDIQVDSVLDACCGSGGFLIDAMADLTEKLKENVSLRPYRKETLENIRTQSIFGIEANPKISRIARMNMYVHGDGGSRIYCSDSLDKTITIKAGTKPELKNELAELRKILISDKKRFDVVISNPPFSMSYRSKEKDEKEILEQYGSEDKVNNLSYEPNSSKLKASVKSNVLFLARYSDLLQVGGKLLIVLDNSVLNSYSHKEYRDFIRRNYNIKAVFQLPTHTFVNQEAGGITSILYLEKRKDLEQEQSSVFARVIENIGHNTAGKEELRDDFDNVLREYEKYEETGRLYRNGKISIREYEDDNLFLVPPSRLTDRIDVYFHQPSYDRLVKELKSKNNQGKCEIKKLSDFRKIEVLKNGEEKDDIRQYKYIDIGAIDKERGFIIDWEEGTRDDLPARAKLSIAENDVLFSKPFRSLKKVVIVPEQFDGELASNGFYGIRPKDYEDACLLWALMRSELIQKQFFHLCSGYTQRELSDEYLDQLLIPVPKNQKELSRRISENIQKAKKARSEEINAIQVILNSPKEFLG